VAQGAYGLVEEVYLLGCPVMASHAEWVQISTVVSGRVVNGYCSNDMILGVLYRASSALWSEVAGLGPVNNVEGVESYDLKDIVDGHLGYRSSLPKVLEFCGFKITRDYFEDEEDEEEQARIEEGEEQARINEQKLREKEGRLKTKQVEYEAKLKKQEELKKIKLEEARVYEQNRTQSTSTQGGGGGWSWWSSKNTSSPDLKKSQSTPAVDLINDITGDLWQPKELKTTLPPLVIDPKKLQRSPLVSRDPSESPSLLDFDTNLDEAGLNSLVSLENNTQDALAASTSSDRYMDQFITGTGPQLGPGDIADRRTDFEYQESEDESIKGSSPRLSRLKIDTGYSDPPRSPLSRSFSGLAPPSASHTRDRVRSASARTSGSITSPRAGYDQNPWAG
jgi:hypothetical protein